MAAEDWLPSDAFEDEDREPAIRRCYRCGAKIQIRQTRSGKWMPYEAVQESRLHQCGAKRALENAKQSYDPL